MYKQFYKILTLILVLGICSTSNAQSSSCRSTVSRAKSEFNRTSGELNRLISQIARDENQIINLKGQLEIQLARFRADEEAAKSDRNFTALRCVLEVTIQFGGQRREFCTPQGNQCVRDAAGCGRLVAMLEQFVQRLTARRRARQISLENRIKPMETRLARNKAKLPAAEAKVATAESKYNAAASKCDATLAREACMKTEISSCKVSARDCVTTKTSCQRDVKSVCNAKPVAERSACFSQGYAACNSDYKTCSAQFTSTACKQKAEVACPA
jgi:hypothetical protein